VVVAAGKAEKAVTAAPTASTPPQAPDQKGAIKELDETVLALLRNRVEYSLLISHLEAKLQGREEEMATLQHYHRSQPKLGVRKRSRSASKASEEE
jgi:hypothetical protein